jgi:hypothetical protein
MPKKKENSKNCNRKTTEKKKPLIIRWGCRSRRKAAKIAAGGRLKRLEKHNFKKICNKINYNDSH